MKKLSVLFSLLLVSPVGLAQPKAKSEKHHSIAQSIAHSITKTQAAAVEVYDPTAVKPLDVVFKHLDEVAKHSKNLKARALRRAYDAFQAKKTARARSLASSVLGDPLFSDYANWIVASAFEADAKANALAKKKSTNPARLAFNHFKAILNGSPYSPLIRLVPKQLGETELLVAYGLAPGKESVSRFEDAFERLSLSGGFADISPDEVVHFAKACKKSPNELCSPWLLRLTERMDRETDEFDAITELFPVLENRPKRPEIPARATQSYRAPDLDLAAFDDAMTAYSSARWDEAQGKFQTFIDEFPKSAYRYRARYWLARTLIEKSKKDEASKEYESLRQDSPLSYYGLLSSLDTNAPFDQPITQTYPEAVDRDPLLSAGETYHLRRAEALIAEKANDLAAMDLREIRPRNALSSPFLMYLCALNYRAESYPMLFVLLSELLQRNYPGIPSNVGLKMIFPVEDIHQITQYAKESGVDPVLVLSLIKQESAFDARAQSGAGAAGLMQLMYFTAAQTVPGISRDDLLDPDQNIKTGTRYLANLLERYHGNIVFALAAYNAGPVPTDRWVRDGEKRKLDMLAFIESIPYRETREYVSSIIRNYYWYSKLLGTEQGPGNDPDTAKADPKPLSYFWKPYAN